MSKFVFFLLIPAGLEPQTTASQTRMYQYQQAKRGWNHLINFMHPDSGSIRIAKSR